MNDEEIFFGNKKTFAIRFIPTTNESFAFAHLVFADEIIGDKNEQCYINSWKVQLQNLKNTIVNGTFYHEEFLNKNDRELFELVLKSNQTESEHHPEYHYLPILDKNIWDNCNISIDETTDDYQIMVVEIDGKLKFIWENIGESCPKNDIGKLKTLIVDKKFVIDTLENCLKTI